MPETNSIPLFKLNEISKELIQSYVHAGRLSYISKINTNRDKSIKRAALVHKAEMKIVKPPIEPNITEEVASNNAGSGVVAGIGVGSQGEPGVDTHHRRANILMTKKIMRRFRDALNSKF